VNFFNYLAHLSRLFKFQFCFQNFKWCLILVDPSLLAKFYQAQLFYCFDLLILPIKLGYLIKVKCDPLFKLFVSIQTLCLVYVIGLMKQTLSHLSAAISRLPLNRPNQHKIGYFLIRIPIYRPLLIKNYLFDSLIENCSLFRRFFLLLILKFLSAIQLKLFS